MHCYENSIKHKPIPAWTSPFETANAKTRKKKTIIIHDAHIKDALENVQEKILRKCERMPAYI